ncbi:hypothetical protein Tco_0195713 [Tanacetum coccineum]
MKAVGVLPTVKTVPRSPQQNGVLNDGTYALVDMLLDYADSSTKLFHFILGRSGCYMPVTPKTESLIILFTDKTPYELVHDNETGILSFLVFLGLRIRTLTFGRLPMFDVYFETSTVDRLVPPAPTTKASVNPTGPSVSIPIDQEAPSGSHSPSTLDHQSSLVHQGVAAEHSFEVNPFTVADPEPFINVFTPDQNSEASSSGVIAITESNQTTQPHEHIQKWTASYPIDNIIGNPSRPVSTLIDVVYDPKTRGVI